MARQTRQGGAAAAGSAVVLCLLLGLVPAPAASAAFSGAGLASLEVSTAALTAPVLSPSCAKPKGAYVIKVPLPGAHAVHYANVMELVVRSPGGVETSTGELAVSSPYAYTFAVNPEGARGAWSYRFQVRYRASATNVWTSPDKTGTFACN